MGAPRRVGMLDVVGATDGPAAGLRVEADPRAPTLWPWGNAPWAPADPGLLRSPLTRLTILAFSLRSWREHRAIEALGETDRAGVVEGDRAVAVLNGNDGLPGLEAIGTLDLVRSPGHA